MTAYSFRVEIEGVQVPGVTEVTHLATEREVVAFREGTAEGDAADRLLPGRWKTGELTMTRPVSADDTFGAWLHESGPAGGLRRSGAVVLYDADGVVVRRYGFSGSWPKRLQIDGLDSGADSVITETLTVVYEHLTTE